ncbi:hypothetical protein ACVGV9_01705, partial [Enterobacter hormaechei]
LKADDVADSIPYVLQAPEHVNVAELFIMPPEQPWKESEAGPGYACPCQLKKTPNPTYIPMYFGLLFML